MDCGLGDEYHSRWRYVPGPDECENLEDYWDGGLHPVDIGDQFCDGKYTVVHKLGAGSDATVWLAQVKDGSESRYVALKILIADISSEDYNELKLHKHLQQQIADGHSMSSVALLLDSFWIKGPNGRHLCLAFEPAGPSLAILRRHHRKFTPDVARALALQATQGLRDLHDAGVVYGDLSSNNILLKLVEINSWTVEELYEKFGHPEPWQVETPDKRPVDEHAPKFVYEGIRFCKTSFEYLQPEIAFVDLADGRLVQGCGQEDATGFSVTYAAPETLWFNEMQDKASDIWALACIFFELRAAKQLFLDDYGDPERAQNNIIEMIGAVPAFWADKLPPTDQSSEETELPEYEEITKEQVPEDIIPEGDIRQWGNDQLMEEAAVGKKKSRNMRSMRWRLHKAWIWFMSLFKTSEMLNHVESEPAGMQCAVYEPRVIPEYFRQKEYVPQDESLHGKIERIGKWIEWHYLSLEMRVARMKEYDEEEYQDVTIADVDDEPPPGPLSDEEKADFENLLNSMFKYERNDRMVLEDILLHPWLNKSYGEPGTGPWLKEYKEGWQGIMLDDVVMCVSHAER